MRLRPKAVSSRAGVSADAVRASATPTHADGFRAGGSGPTGPSPRPLDRIPHIGADGGAARHGGVVPWACPAGAQGAPREAEWAAVARNVERVPP
ncbi:hypothetical protein, partial [Streptomyces sp. NPDC059781]|uniref:hypothetical protein n=1 Tax=Streptomyces sp. NPDC059781 TaxID=3346943 RepID=UPI0036640A33